MWGILIKEPHVFANIFLAVSSERRSARTELSEVRDSPTPTKKHAHKAAKPSRGCWRLSVWGKWRRGGALRHMTRRSNGLWRWTSQDWNVYLCRERRGKNSLVVSNAGLPGLHVGWFNTRSHSLRLRLLLYLEGKESECSCQTIREKQDCFEHTHRKESTPVRIQAGQTHNELGPGFASCERRR